MRICLTSERREMISNLLSLYYGNVTKESFMFQFQDMLTRMYYMFFIFKEIKLLSRKNKSYLNCLLYLHLHIWGSFSHFSVSFFKRNSTYTQRLFPPFWGLIEVTCKFFSLDIWRRMSIEIYLKNKLETLGLWAYILLFYIFILFKLS